MFLKRLLPAQPPVKNASVRLVGILFLHVLYLIGHFEVAYETGLVLWQIAPRFRDAIGQSGKYLF